MSGGAVPRLYTGLDDVLFLFLNVERHWDDDDGDDWDEEDDGYTPLH